LSKKGGSFRKKGRGNRGKKRKPKLLSVHQGSESHFDTERGDAISGEKSLPKTTHNNKESEREGGCLVGSGEKAAATPTDKKKANHLGAGASAKRGKREGEERGSRRRRGKCGVDNGQFHPRNNII